MMIPLTRSERKYIAGILAQNAAAFSVVCTAPDFSSYQEIGDGASTVQMQGRPSDNSVSVYGVFWICPKTEHLDETSNLTLQPLTDLKMPAKCPQRNQDKTQYDQNCSVKQQILKQKGNHGLWQKMKVFLKSVLSIIILYEPLLALSNVSERLFKKKIYIGCVVFLND